MLDVYSPLGSAQDSKCASSAILGKDFLTSSPPSYLGQAPGAGEKKFPTALVVGGLIVGGVVLYYASRVGGTLANPSGDDRTYEVWQFSGKDGYGEASGLSWDEAVAEAEAIHARTGREVRVFDEEDLANAPPSKLPKAKKVVKRARKANDQYSPFHGELLPGGRAAGMRPEDFDPAELARGTKHELEHTDDWRVAREIASDHLAEDEAYYQKLDAMERGAFRGNPLEYDDSRDAWCDTGTGRCGPNAPFRDNPKLQWQGSGSGSWARGPGYGYYKLVQRAPGEWVVYYNQTLIGAERTPALAKQLAQAHTGHRDNPWSKESCVKDCEGTFGKNNKPEYLKKCLAACRGVLLGKGLADLPKGA